MSHRLASDCNGDAVVEATVLFPVMVMIFAALVLISVYLPSQAALQSAAGYAAAAIATEISDTWLRYDGDAMAHYWETDINRLDNVYVKLFSRPDIAGTGEIIVQNMFSRSISPAGELAVTCYLNNKLVYKEVIIEASRKYKMPVNLSFIGFPETLTVTASAVAVVQNGDEFIRNMDLATGFAQFAAEKFGLGDIGESINTFGSRVRGILGWQP